MAKDTHRYLTNQLKKSINDLQEAEQRDVADEVIEELFGKKAQMEHILSAFKVNFEKFKKFAASKYSLGDDGEALVDGDGVRWKKSFASIVNNFVPHIQDANLKLQQLHERWKAAATQQEKEALCEEVASLKYFAPRDGKHSGKKTSLTPLPSTSSARSPSPRLTPSDPQQMQQTHTQVPMDTTPMPIQQPAAETQQQREAMEVEDPESTQKRAWRETACAVEAERIKELIRGWLVKRSTELQADSKVMEPILKKLFAWCDRARQGGHQGAMQPNSAEKYIPTEFCRPQLIERYRAQLKQLSTNFKIMLRDVQSENDAWQKLHPDGFSEQMAAHLLLPGIVCTLVSFKLFFNLGELTKEEFLDVVEGVDLDCSKGSRGERLFNEFRADSTRKEWTRFRTNNYVSLGGARTCTWAFALNFPYVVDEVICGDVHALLARDMDAVQALKARREFSTQLTELLTRDRLAREVELTKQKQMYEEQLRQHELREQQLINKCSVRKDAATVNASHVQHSGEKRKVTFGGVCSPDTKRHKADQPTVPHASAWSAALKKPRHTSSPSLSTPTKSPSTTDTSSLASVPNTGTEWLARTRLLNATSQFATQNEGGGQQGVTEPAQCQFSSEEQEVFGRIENYLDNYNSFSGSKYSESVVGLKEAATRLFERVGLVDQMSVEDFVQQKPMLRGERKISIGSVAVTKTAGTFLVQSRAALASKIQGKVGPHTNLLANLQTTPGVRAKKNGRLSQKGAATLANAVNSSALHPCTVTLARGVQCHFSLRVV